MSVEAAAHGRETVSLSRMLLEHARAQFLVFVRNVALSAASVILPALLFAFIAMTGAAQEYAPGVTFGAYFLASMAAYAVSSVMIFNFGVTVAVERAQKVDLLVRAAPVPPVIYLFARVITALAFALGSLLILFAFAHFAAGVTLPAATWLELAAGLLLGSIPFIALGFAIAYVAGADAAVAIANITYLMLAFASGIFIPFNSLPDFVRSVSPLLPTYHYAQIAWSSVGLHAESLAASALWLAGYGLAFFALAAWAYRREELRRFV